MKIIEQITNANETKISSILAQFHSNFSLGMFALSSILLLICCYCFIFAARDHESISQACESPDETVVKIDLCEFNNRSLTIKLNFIKPQPKLMASCKLLIMVQITLRRVCRPNLNFSGKRTVSSIACSSRQLSIGVR